MQYVFLFFIVFFNVYVFNYLVSVPLNYSVCSHLLLPFLVIVMEELGRNQIPTEVRSHKFGLALYRLPFAVQLLTLLSLFGSLCVPAKVFSSV